MFELSVRPVRWVNDEPQPGVVEVELIDANEHPWRFLDKAVIFSAEWLSGEGMPERAAIRCTIVEVDGELALVNTAAPDHVESVDGQHLFRVRRDQLIEPSGAA